jgi:hypothetical protein
MRILASSSYLGRIGCGWVKISAGSDTGVRGLDTVTVVVLFTAPGTFARLLPLALAVSCVAGACSPWSADLAVVPGTPQAQAKTPTAKAQRTPAPVPTPAGQQTARGDVGNQAPKPKVLRYDPRPQPGAFAIDLYRKGDFMHQATKNLCVAGSTQTMMNIIDSGRANRSIAFQQKLYERGRQLSPNKTKLGPIGVDLSGWVDLLNTAGYGPYVVEASDTRRGAIRKAAKALRETGRPVGLVTWRGAHSWVMSGFTATADPAHTSGFMVKGAYIQDTWYPYVSTIWGASNPPDTLVPLGKLKEDYLPYVRPRANYPKRDGKFMLILPVLPANTVVR